MKTTRENQYNIRSRLSKLKDALMWNLVYTVGYSSVAGISNGLANVNEGGDFKRGFGEAYVNNVPMGLMVNSVYPVLFNKLKKTKNFRLYANLATLGINSLFMAGHYLAGTENPVEATLPCTAIGLAMANAHVSAIQNKSLERRIK